MSDTFCSRYILLVQAQQLNEKKGTSKEQGKSTELLLLFCSNWSIVITQTTEFR